MVGKLTPRQERFVAAYTGDATAAAIAAGYSPGSARSAGGRLARDPRISAALASRQDAACRALVASRQERQAFWSQVMGDAEEDMTVRLRASELLGRSEADFTEKHQHSGGVTIAVVAPYPEKRRG